MGKITSLKKRIHKITRNYKTKAKQLKNTMKRKLKKLISGGKKKRTNGRKTKGRKTKRKGTKKHSLLHKLKNKRAHSASMGLA